MTDKLRSYSSALREMAPSLIHITKQYANNRAEVSHEPTRQQERQMRRFKSAGQAQRFLSFHGLVNNLCRQPRHLLSAVHYRILRDKAFTTWKQAVGVN
jgi:putative transposase